MEHKISVQNISKSFGDKKIIDDISFNLQKGKALVVIGGSGSGKSVLIKNIIGLMHPESGNILIDGKDIHQASTGERKNLVEKFGVLFQGGALFDSLLVWQNISFIYMQTGKMSKAEGYEHAINKLASVGLSAEIADLFPAELSGGMQKRVALARAISCNPEIIFFDEPTTGLDPIMADVINDLIIKCSKELGATTITITHDMHSAKKIADEIAMIYKGKFIWHGARDHLETAENAYLQQFITGSAYGPITMETQDHLRENQV